MKTLLNWTYGLAAYLAGFVMLLYFIGFSVGVLTRMALSLAEVASKSVG